MAATTVNPDLARARAQATFDPLQLTHFIYDGPEKTNRKRYLQNIAIKESEEQGFRRNAELSREEQYEEALRKSTYAYRRTAELGLKDMTDIYIFRESIFDESPFALQYVAFEPTVKKLGTEEQKAKWLPLIQSFQVIGTYAQTELGHGTFLRGLETTATYDAKTREFVINSPTTTSAKFWPGGLGKTSNHCVVMAKLNLDGRDCGMQSFIVPIRDVDTHLPLPGVSVGDIGPKFGYGGMDNGFLILKNVRIPRENMLMRYAQVQEDGTFVSPKNDKLVYGSMTLIRAQLVGSCARALSKAVTIATRYSAVRKQSEINPGAGEVQVLDFQTQQHRLFVQIATAYALSIAGRASIAAYNRVSAQIETGALEELPILHALSAALKAFSSWEMAYGVEQCRLACGGHGYSLASGLPKIYAHEVPACTYEGENTVLCLQTARFLMKCQESASRGEKLPSFVRYLNNAKNVTSKLSQDFKLEDLVAAYEHRAGRMIAEASKRIQDQLALGLKPAEAWNMSSQKLVDATIAFTHAFVVKAFIQTVSAAKFEPSLATVMQQLCQLYALYGITKYSGQFAQGGYLSDQQLDLVEKKLYDLLASLKPNAVALVDAFDFPDCVLDSDLGRYDGNVYEALMEFARRSKLNKSEVHEGFYKYQKPFVDSLKAQSKL
ncbi:peroxisomal acyl-coenzyme A oxidase 1-like isoform X2 [Physella acuta]|uniref:peroxisomal acyl-coenzyme A oxidase 1-like isoform X2 n=1 Tax=Physella acuta TaxID=109671 RepID=UPI0027DCF37C|nr:peroxisomal acyl-coenzyme A oxidase 1-like isoform X2 [Physella acuta]